MPDLSTTTLRLLSFFPMQLKLSTRSQDIYRHTAVAHCIWIFARKVPNPCCTAIPACLYDFGIGFWPKIKLDLAIVQILGEQLSTSINAVRVVSKRVYSSNLNPMMYSRPRALHSCVPLKVFFSLFYDSRVCFQQSTVSSI